MKSKLFFTLLLALVASFFVTAQTPETPVAGTSFIEIIIQNVMTYGVFVLALYELVIRYFPTVKTYSILAEIIRLLDFLIPDNNTEGGTHLPIVRSLTVQDVKVGDVVRTKDGELLTVKDIFSSAKIVAQNTEGGATGIKNITIDDILEIVKKGYLLVDTLKAIWKFIKQIFSKA